nr:MAG TPA: hypothetical protein [Caudoviricetes sp.]
MSECKYGIFTKFECMFLAIIYTYYKLICFA